MYYCYKCVLNVIFFISIILVKKGTKLYQMQKKKPNSHIRKYFNLLSCPPTILKKDFLVFVYIQT